MKVFKKLLSIMVTVFMVFGIFSVPLKHTKANTVSKEQKINELIKSKLTKLEDVDYSRALSQKYGIDILNDNVNPYQEKNISKDDDVRIIVQLSSPSVYEMTKGKKVTLQQSKNFEESVDAAQKPIINKVENLGQIRHKYRNLLNGFSAVIKYGDIDAIREISGVKSVKVANKYYLDMNTAVNFTNAPTVWNKFGLKGEGVVVAIVDTGIDYTHKDMKLTDASKAKLSEKDVQAFGGPGKFYTEKVPYGYNFADMNDRIIPQSSMHGMHVSGIVAANGNDEEIKDNHAIKGVAPEAQLLAMKVFTNNPNFQSAFNDDIAAAIEDSYKHGADVVNISLGSTAGFVDYDDPEQVAIKNATDAGVVVVVSAGNSGYATQDVHTPYYLDSDISVVGSPGLFTDALQVASSENTNIIFPAFDYKSGEETGSIAYYVTNLDPVVSLSGSYQVIDCLLGRVDDFKGKDLNGKIALIQRGGITFVEKEINAQNAGAAGVIVYNKAGDDSYINMITDPSVHIPAVFLSYTDGNKLKGLIQNGVEVSFAGNVRSIPNSAAGQMSDYSSWGTAPGLEFKPEVTAPGGNIYSTLNNNKYGMMSGTSMAAPHTSGATALVVQYLKSLELNLKGRDFVNLAKTLLINSSEPIMDPETTLPYSPRKQGAGLIQIDKAAQVKAYACDSNGNAAIALKVIDNETVFKVVIKNFGKETLTFIPSAPYGVLTNYVKNGFMYPNDVNFSNAALTFSRGKISVPANGSAEITATLTIPNNAAKNIFAEGFIKLTEKDGKSPVMTVPYVGFYGAWSGQEGPRMFDAPIWDTNTFFGMTALLDNETYFLGQKGKDENGNPIIDPNCIGFSPNGDDLTDGVMPLLSFMRNAGEFKVLIVDKDGKPVREIAKDMNIRKNYTDRRTDFYTFNNDWAWDGTVYDSATGSYKQAPEGQYFVKVMAKPDFEGADWYEMNMPVKLDITAPTFEIKGEKLEGNNYKIKLLSESDGDGVGIQQYRAFIFDEAGNYVSDQDLKLGGADSETTITIPGFNCNIIVAAIDYANNAEIKPLQVQNNAVMIDVTNLKPYYNEENVTINYAINDLLWNTVDHVGITFDSNPEVNNEKNLSYTILKPLEGEHTLKITLYGSDGKNVGENSVSFVVDRTMPGLDILKKGESYDVEIRPLEGGKLGLVWKLSVSDKLTGYELFVNGESFDKVEPNPKGVSKTYEYVTELMDGQNAVTVKAVDFAGNQAAAAASVSYDLNVPIIRINDCPAWIMGKEAAVSGSIIWNSEDKINEVIVDGKPVILNEDNTFSASVSTDSYGEKDILVSVNTEAGKTSSTPIKIKFSPFSEALNNEFVTNSSSFVIEYNVNTADTSISSVRISYGSSQPIDNGINQKSVALENLTEGQNQVTFSALSADGNVIASENVMVYVDTVRPEVRIVDENGKDFTGNDYYKKDLKLLVIPSEKLKSLTINGEPYPGDSLAGIPIQLQLIDGMNRITVSMEDMAGNTNDYQFKVFADTLPPEVTLIDLQNDKIVVTDDIYDITMEIKDNVYGFKVYINGEQIAVEQSSTGEGIGPKEINYPYKVPEGKSILKLEVVDYFGNKFEKTITFYKNYKSAVIIDNAKEINKLDAVDTEINVVFNGDSIDNITAKSVLEKDKDYLITDNGITFKKEFLMTLPIGENNIAVKFTSGITENILFTVTDGRSNDASLKYIKINGTIIKGFLPDKLDYIYEVSPVESKLPELVYEAGNDKSQIIYVPAEKQGDTAQIKVTAQDGTVRTYTVKFVVPIAFEKISADTNYVPGNDAKVDFKATNMSDVDKGATLIICLYDTNGNMVDCVIGIHTIKANESAGLSAIIKIPDNAYGYKIRCFAWDTFDDMNPLSEAYEFLIVKPR